MKSFRLLFILLMLSTTAFSQANLFGTLSGVILDKSSKETIIGANIMVVGTEFGTATDFDGFFAINNVPAGKYTVQISYIGYENITISDVEVKAGENFKLDVVMSSGSLVLEEITVTEYRKTNTVQAVLLEVKQAKQVVSGVSSQQITRSQDNNAAQVMARIPGVTIVDGRFVMIRGLSERYNNVMINNVTAPSTEVDRRTFSFDLISTSALDRMLIYKSGSAEYPGDFAGGVIKLFTVEDVENNFTRLNVGLGYRANTSLMPYWQSKGSTTDFLGFDNGFRQLPSNFPRTRALKESGRNAQLRQDAAHSLPNNWQPTEGMATPDYSVGFTLGRNMTLGGKKLSTITSVNYSTSFQHFNRDFNRYFSWEDQTRPIDLRFQFNDASYEKQNRISILSNWKWKSGNRSTITFKNLFNQIGENETILRSGFDFIQRPNDNLQNYLLGYRMRSIYTGQLEGNHQLSDLSALRWVAGGSFLRELEPDLRRFRTFRPKDQGDQNFIMQLPPSSNLFDTGRYYGDLMEFSANHGMDYSRKLPGVGSKGATLKGGYYADYRYRDFDSRYVSYLYPGFFDPSVREQLERLPLDEVFSNENIRTNNGFVLEEGTRGIDSYNASSITGAAYLSGEASVGRIDLTGGLRGEYNVQTIKTVDDVVGLLKVNNPTFALLPFVNAGLNLNDDNLLRLAYSRTVNRPEFRELAPFVFYDYKLEAGRFGNPDLQSAGIHNIDLRYEMYPRPGETFSVGLFYKYFNNPIENKTVITTEQPQFTYINADFARSYGIEVELRKSLRGMTGSAFLDRFSVNANASLIRSTVDLGASATAQDRVRPLQGQSPYIVNVALYYEEPVSNLNAALIYNIFGDRIFSVGDVLFPTIYELSRNSLDFTITKRVKRVSYKLGIQNILDAPFRFFEDSDRTEKITLDRDNPIIAFRRGQLASLSLTFDLNKP
ncbi:MAG: outer membrane beta-barrel protein [Saprospiraceae bacterium]|nr:outer membrane beta-barrel protein [Saprospiraceae bacterium]HRD80823.1 outer membrane beta-barrel protein [Saprospiraceae bacterium]